VAKRGLGKPAASSRHIAVVGAGWAGCAAALELARAGHRVTLLESARTLGGRARRVDTEGRILDNGQHIMLGAYVETLRLLKLAGIDAGRALLNVPLQMRYPAGSGGMDFIAPRWPAPLHLGWALLRAKGLAREDKISLARFSTTARWMNWRLHTDCSVSELLERFDQTARLTRLMWRPLCLAALNTPPERASAQIFLNVLRDSLGARRAASDMLLPRYDLSALFPSAAAAFVERHGGKVRTACQASALHRTIAGRWQIALRVGAAALEVDFDGVVLATPAAQAALLLAGAPEPAAATAAQLGDFEYEAITTCYLQYSPTTRLPQAFLALVDAPQAGQWGQFVFDRGQLDAAQAGMLAVIISASGAAAQLGQQELTAAVTRQLDSVFPGAGLAAPLWSRIITEKRATFACTPGLVRPQNATGVPGLVIAGDYTASDYPATIESAVRSGVAAAAAVVYMPG
jgi:squalene-associated FAD-dependent desaturase